MPSLAVGDPPLNPQEQRLQSQAQSKPKSQQASIAQYLQPQDQSQGPAVLTPATVRKQTASSASKAKKTAMTPKDKEDAEVIDRKTRKKPKDQSAEAKAQRKDDRRRNREEKAAKKAAALLAKKRGVQPIQADGSNQMDMHGGNENTAMSPPPVETNPLNIPLPDDNSEANLEEQQEAQQQNNTADGIPNAEEDEQLETETGAASYAEAAAAASNIDDDNTAVQKNRTFQVQRLRLTLVIKKPSDKEQRLKLLQDKANDMMRIGKQFEKEMYLQDFFLTSRTEDGDNKRQWHSKFKAKDCSTATFKQFFAHGLENYFPLDRDRYHFRISIVVPHTCCIKKLLEEMNGIAPKDCSIRHILSQGIYNPKKVGALLRSTDKLTATDEFLSELNRRAASLNPNVVFGMSCAELRHPNIPQCKDYKNANKAIQLETNAEYLTEATEIALRLFPAKRPKGFVPIWGMNCVFIFDYTHPAVQNLSAALTNLATLINRHQTFRDYQKKVANQWILQGVLDDPVYEDGDRTTLRDVLMSIKSKTTPGCENGTLFSAICYDNYLGQSKYWFMCHKKVQKEAKAVVRALPTMLRVEYNVTPEHFFVEGGIDPTEDWNAETRCLSNEVTNATDMMLEETEDLHEDREDEEINVPIIDENDNISLPTVDERERKRLMGQDDEETIKDMTKKKPIKKKKQSAPTATIAVDAAQTDDHSELGMGSIAGESKTRRAQREVLDEATILITTKNAELEKKLKEEQKERKKMQKANEKMNRQMARILAKMQLEEDQEEADEEADSNSGQHSGSQQSGGQRSGENGSRLHLDLNPETVTQDEIDNLYPTDNEEVEGHYETSEEEEEQFENDNESSSEDDSEEESSSSSESSGSEKSKNTLPLIPPHISTQSIAKNLEESFDNAKNIPINEPPDKSQKASTGGEPGRQT